MFQITLLAMGKLKEKFYLSAAAEYEKRLSGVCRFQLLELPECRLPESPQPAEIAMGLAKEGELIRQKIPKGAWFCVLTPEGKELSSEAFKSINALISTLCLVFYFIISFATMAWYITWVIFPLSAAIQNIVKACFDLKD